MYSYEDIGEEMITKVNGPSFSGIVKDPRRKAQSMQFKNSSFISAKNDCGDQFVQRKNNALLTSVSIVAGSILFTVGYFMLSAFAMNLKK